MVVKRFFIFTLLLCFILAPASINVMAQDDLSETLESADVGFTMSYPDGWESLENLTSGYLAAAEDEQDLEVAARFDEHLNSLHGQAVFIVPTATDGLGAFGQEVEDRLLGIAEGFGQTLNADDLEQIDVAGGYETWRLLMELDEASLILVELHGTQGYSFFIFAGAPLDDADSLEENFLAMLDTVETITPEIPPDITGDGTYHTESAEAIEYGDTVEGEVTDDLSYVVYSFEGSEGDVVTISMVDTSRSNSLDPLVILLDEEGSEVTRNDDAGSINLPDSFDAMIDHFELPADGVYYIVATRFGEFTGIGGGHFSLRLDEGDGDSARTYDVDAAEAIEYGDTVEGEVTSDSPFILYSFEGSEGDMVTISMVDTSRDGALDPQVILLDEDGSELVRNDDALSSDVVPDFQDSQIAAFELPADGTYFIVATRFLEDLGNSEGDFALTLDEGS
jgi:hypothetical protein